MILPLHWRRGLVADLIDGIDSGKNLRCEERPPAPAEVGIVKISAVTWGSFDASKSKTVNSGTQLPESTRIRAGDLLISRAKTLELVGATVLAGEAPSNLHLSDKVLRLRAKSGWERWLNLFLNSAEGRIEIEARATGNQLSMRNIGQDAIRSIPLPIPPLAEQRRIVARIEALFARTRRARADLERIAPLASASMRAATSAGLGGELSAAWRRKHPHEVWTESQQRELEQNRARYLEGRRGVRLASIPEFVRPGSDKSLPPTWAVGCIADAATLRLGYAFKSEWFSGSGPKLLRGANIAPGQLDWRDEKRLSAVRAVEFAAYKVEAGNIVIAMDRPMISTGLKIARVPVADAGSMLVQRVASPTLSDMIDADFLWYVLQGPAFSEQIERRSTGTDLPHISGNDILDTVLPLPPVSEQREIAARLDNVAAQLLPARADSVRTIALLDRLEQSILSRAFRGELVPQDPNEAAGSATSTAVNAEQPARARRSRAA